MHVTKKRRLELLRSVCCSKSARPRSFFGEMSLLDGQPRTATATTL